MKLYIDNIIDSNAALAQSTLPDIQIKSSKILKQPKVEEIFK